ncbi:hypothetical protein BJ170DRAFT_377193 [Xylariales sp. AK1849]|nr:hypothetical protein BJ170DRAFT_377193 [Xylariales sp. AK1849]
MPMLASTSVGVSAVTRELPTKYATPRRLSVELEGLLGSKPFRVVMRHNVYTIESSTAFDVDILLRNCQADRQVDLHCTDCSAHNSKTVHRGRD